MIKSFIYNFLNRKKLAELQKVENNIFYYVYYEAILTQKLEDLYDYEYIDDFFNDNMNSIQDIFKSLPTDKQIEKLKTLKLNTSVFGTTDSDYLRTLIDKCDLVHNFILYKYLMVILNDSTISREIKKEATINAYTNFNKDIDKFTKVFEYLKLDFTLESKENTKKKLIKL